MGTSYQALVESSDAGQQRERQLWDVLNNLPCVVFQAYFTTADALPSFSFVNAGAARLLGVDAEHIVREPVAAFSTVLPEDLAALQAGLRAAAKVAERWQAEFRVTVMGSVRWIEGHAQFQSLSGGARLARGYWADITERKRVELDSLRLQRRFEQSFEAAVHPTLLADPAGNITAVNSAYTQLLGYTHADVPSVSACFERLFPDPRYRAQVLHARKEALRHFERTGEPAPALVAHVRCKDRSERVVEARFRSADAETIVTLHDITDRVHAETGKQRAMAERDELQVQLHLQSERMPMALLISDANEQLTLREWNPAAERIFGYSRREVLGRTPYELIVPPQLWQTVRTAFCHPTGGDETVRALTENCTKDGRTICCEWFITPLREHNGKTTQVMAMVQDVTQRVESEARMRLWSHVLEQSAEGIFICDPQQRILLVNPAFEKLTGFSAQEAIGSTPSILKSGRQSPAFYAELWKTLNASGAWQGEMWNRRKDGRLYVAWLSITAVRDKVGAVAHYVGIFSDITERKASEQRIEHLAQYDALTDLPNRILLGDRLGQVIKAAGRNGSKVAVVFVDLDRFKDVNDSLGHDIGDVLLQTVAKRLSYTVRAEDTVARLGGDEFVVVLPDLRTAQDVATVAQKLMESLVHPIRLEGHELTVTASLGVSVYPDDATDGQELLRNADAAMYAAKAAGRNACRFYTADMNLRALEALSVESALRRALERNELELHYQPQIDLVSGELIGAEALIRWNHPDKGLVMPGSFIPIAEERGLIVAIGTWVIEQATRQLAIWGSNSLPIAVNLSSVQFHQKNFVERVAKTLEVNHVSAGQLELELTESIIMRDADTTIGVLQSLHELGIRLSIDDFGTGYSSLNYLRRFPIDKIKIDQSFVREMAEEGDTAMIVNGIIALAKSLKLKVIAEGVETSRQLELLRAQGCDEAQGYLFSRALPVAAFEKLVQHWKPSV